MVGAGFQSVTVEPRAGVCEVETGSVSSQPSGENLLCWSSSKATWKQGPSFSALVWTEPWQRLRKNSQLPASTSVTTTTSRSLSVRPCDRRRSGYVFPTLIAIFQVLPQVSKG